MAMHRQSFRDNLFTEHLEEGAFQYETRLSWFSDESIAWQDLGDVDGALEAHIDALALGRNRALKVCLDNLADAEASMLHVIVRVFCRHRLIDRLSQLWTEFDFDDRDKVIAVADALKWECPKEWQPELMKAFEASKTDLFPLFAPSISYLSRGSSQCLLTGLAKAKPQHLVDIIASISRCDRSLSKDAVRSLAPQLKSKDSEVVAKAALALMMMGEKRTLSECGAMHKSMPVAFALGGDIKESEALIAIANEGQADEECLFALGLSGNLEAVPHLLNYLKHPDYGLVAAKALHMISGAPLYEDQHIEEPVEEDELFEFELEAYKKGELPKNIEGESFGAEQKVLSIDRELWFSWLQKHKQQFTKGLRYRFGKPFSPAVLYEALIANQGSSLMREYAHQELVIRYGFNAHFAADDPIVKQQYQLKNMQDWVKKSEGLFPAGQWCFNGQVMGP